MPKVSVILSVYNVEPYIGKCIESLRAQTMRELEFVFVDDCCTDGSMAAVEAWAEQDPRVCIIRNEENMGAEASRNRGIEAARGDYISFIEPDGYVSPNFYKLLYAAATADGGHDIATGVSRKADAPGGPVSAIGRRLKDRTRWDIAHGKPLYLAHTGEIQTAIFKRSLLSPEDSGPLLLRLCRSANDIVLEKRARYVYRDHMKISVIMPVYNAEAYLQESIQSFLDQSLKETEIICVDDGSTDSSLEILESFQRKDRRVRVFSQANQGAGSARNLALAEARGEYVAFLDSDDRYPDEIVLEVLYALAKRHETKAAGGSLLFLDGERLSPARWGSIDFGFQQEGVINYRDLQQAYYYQRFIYSREMLISADISFPPYRRFQDVVFFVRTMIEADQIAVTDMPSYVYRKSNKFSQLSNEQINDMLLGYIDTFTLANEHGLDKLSDFLAERLTEGSFIHKMVSSSIESGNEIARERYDAVVALMQPPQAKLESERNARRIISRAVKKLRTHF